MEFLEQLRNANQARQKLWDPENKISGSIGKLFRSNELVGEAGEAANEIKKLVREEMNIKGSRTTSQKLADELADVIICADLVAEMYEINLIDSIRGKFNETSDKVGFDIKL